MKPELGRPFCPSINSLSIVAPDCYINDPLFLFMLTPSIMEAEPRLEGFYLNISDELILSRMLAKWGHICNPIILLLCLLLLLKIE